MLPFSFSTRFFFVSVQTLTLSLGIWLLCFGQSWAQCTVAIEPVVSKCYNTTAGSRATISVEVSWTNTTPSTIVITAGALSRTLITGSVSLTYQGPITTTGTGALSLTGVQPIVSPQLVTFELPANGASVNVSASYTGQPGCTAATSVTMPVACAKQACTTSTTALQGSVFRDFGADGLRGPTESLGIDGVNVRAVACDGTIYTGTTDINGDYRLSVPASQYPVRVEFTNIPAATGFGTRRGADGGTTVQFVDAPSCNNSLGLLSPADFCQENPSAFVPCYVNGDPLATPPTGLAATAVAGTTDAFVSFDYGATGTKGSAPITMEATAAQVGTVWGVAYDKTRDRVYSSATIKRHAGLGPLGLGGIYITDPATNVTSPLLSVTALGVNVGTILTNPARGLTADKTAPSVDTEGWVKIGKVGIGDIDLNENDRRLYFTNLFDKRVYYLNFSGTSGTPTVTLGGSFSLPVTCTNGELRPFALKVYDNRVFVGAVCDASVSQSKSDLRAYVLAFDPVTNTTTQVMDFPLTYPKGPPFLNITGGNTLGSDRAGWYPWTTRANPGAEFLTKSYVNGANRFLQYPEPIFTDIEFDLDGSMILGFGDVTGLQGGLNNYSPDPAAATSLTATAFAGGDLLRAFSSGTGSTFILEDNARAGDVTGSGVNNAQGPGLGEFYNDDFFNAVGRLVHTEIVFGGVALRPGSGEVMTTVMDPINGFNNAGGVRKLNNTTGQTNSAFELYASLRGDAGTFAKAVGLGDLELTCQRPTYLQIGNRVWKDTDGDGEQDACEEPLPGVRVALYRSGTLVTTTLTDANGEYYFTYEPASSTLTYPGATSALLPETAYQIAFGQGGQWGSDILSVDGGRYRLTTPNSITGGARSDRSDSDAQIVSVGGILLPVISITTGLEGSVNHTFDAGFVCLPASAVASVTAATCNGVTARSNAVVSLSAIQNANRVFLVTTGGAIPSYTATGSQPVSASAASFTGLANPTSISGQSYSVVLYNGPCCFTVLQTVLPRTDCACSVSLTLGTPVCNSVTNQYIISGSVSFTNAGNTLTISDGAATTTVSATGISPQSFTLSGSSLVSDASIHTLTATASSTASCTVSSTYTAPESCSAAPPCSATVAVTRGLCQSATNTYSATAVVRLTNPTPGVLTLTSTATPTTFTANVPAGLSSYSFTATYINTLPSTGATETVTASLTSGCAASTTYAAPVSCSVAPVCSMTAVVTNGLCQSATNTYSSTVVVSITNPTPGLLSVQNGPQSLTTNVPSGLSSFTFTPVFGSLPSTGANVTVLASLPGGCFTNTAYTTPVSCSTVPVVTYALTKVASPSRVVKGGIVTYTVSVTNTSTTSATNVVITDALSSTGATVVGSATTSAGTFTGGNWTIPVLAGGASATLQFQARLNEEGITFNTATTPDGTTASVCTSVPIQVCAGVAFQIDLSAPSGQASYQWFQNGALIPGAVGRVYSATAVGEYTVSATSSGSCPSGSCCPMIIEATPAPSLSAVAVAATCVGPTPNADGKLMLVSSSPNSVSYNVSLGSAFGTPLFDLDQSLSAVVGGVLLSGQASPLAPGQTYTFRVYAADGCYSDSTVLLPPSVCACPPPACVPFRVTRIR
jgi:uncharacterized repeat protein (TIGR01451 family)